MVLQREDREISGNNDVARSDDRVWSKIAAGDSQLLHHGVQGRSWHPETGGRRADYATGLPENAQDVIPLHFLKRRTSGGFHCSGAQFSQGSAEVGTPGEDDRPLNEVLKLPYIPGPRPTHQGSHRGRWNSVNRAIHLGGVLLGEVPGEYGYVLGMIPQRWCSDREYP